MPMKGYQTPCLPGIHQLLIMLPPRPNIAFPRDELGGFAMVGFQKVNGFLPFDEPELVLGHNATSFTFKLTNLNWVEPILIAVEGEVSSIFSLPNEVLKAFLINRETAQLQFPSIGG